MIQEIENTVLHLMPFNKKSSKFQIPVIRNTNSNRQFLRLMETASKFYSVNSTAHLRLQYTFGSAIFFKFGFLGQSSGRRIISNF